MQQLRLLAEASLCSVCNELAPVSHLQPGDTDCGPVSLDDELHQAGEES